MRKIILTILTILSTLSIYSQNRYEKSWCSCEDNKNKVIYIGDQKYYREDAIPVKVKHDTVKVIKVVKVSNNDNIGIGIATKLPVRYMADSDSINKKNFYMYRDMSGNIISNSDYKKRFTNPTFRTTGFVVDTNLYTLKQIE